ncbi:MAG TPA: 50S ribosomal protein L5 [Armatimonadota bacterium]|nr:50S ribosomal protein L5 [Armatimonadota bacterium]
MARLKERYQKEIVPALKEQLELQNVMEVPRLDKVVINMGLGQGEADPKQLDAAVRELASISGQRPAIARARKSIAQFKIRQGHRIGAHVTLRGDRMYEFLDKLDSVVFPRVRDFSGLNPRSFDGHGNYSLGMKDQSAFPEIDYDTPEFRMRGMDITICTTARTDEAARALLKALGVPIRER